MLPALLCLHPGAATAADETQAFVIRSIDIKRDLEGYRLDSVVDFDLNPTVLEALQNGVSMTLETRIRLYRERDWMWDQRISHINRRFSLRYFALSQLYLLTDLDNHQRYSFVSLNAALYRLGHLQTPLVKLHQVLTGQPHYLQMQILLDIESLPAPLRPLAYLSSRWRLKSEWKQWTIEL